ncbi:hypothetical protein VSS37_03315 [Candidatus Thiothrix sp. Deng01]|uniref:DUF222 domain-containing protein n=1 Tax=Candidatus Thiothrix phosphatis TaxID=3112415 RepID=A0ABU6CV40_9GAMM|nr:hypothetical protein [Candidatus Thiothrix sp. Deng01]MEB4589999.1 hypothetical protein [Candidatus Thiothrix sp. Deng01]
MSPDQKKELAVQITATAEVMSLRLSENALLMMVEDLSAYSLDAVRAALKRTRRECKRLTIADVIERINDGRPTPEQAWAGLPRSEHETALLTAEMMSGLSVAAPLIDAGEMIQARIAFLEVYRAECARARADITPVKWSVSLGFDIEHREKVLALAVQTGKLQREYAISLLPQRSPTKAGCALISTATAIADQLPIIAQQDDALTSPALASKQVNEYQEQCRLNAEQAGAILKDAFWSGIEKGREDKKKVAA